MAPNPEMLLILEPMNELKLFGDFDAAQPPQAKIQVTNPTPYSIHFKLKTTATTRYWVTPKMGLLLPYSQETIIIGMRAPKGETQDKFKLIAMVAADSVKKNKEIWDNVNESQCMVHKWVVVFIDDAVAEEPTAKSAAPAAAQKTVETIPSIAKIISFILVGFVAVASSLYRLKPV